MPQVRRTGRASSGKIVYSTILKKAEVDFMKRRFNVTGSCNPQRDYMVRLDDRLKKIKEDYVD